MSTKSTDDITAAEWLDVRDTVAGVVKQSTRNMQAPTSVNVAEQLLRRGFIDVDVVRKKVADDNKQLDQADHFDEPTEAG